MWAIEYNGSRKSLSEWGVKNLKRTLVSLDIDTLTFEMPADVDADGTFAHGATLKLYRDEVLWFLGRIDQTPRMASGRYEGHGYVVVGPWWYLRNLVFQMAWKVLKNPLEPDEGLVEVLESHLILNLTTSGQLASTKAQIRQALQYCIDSGAPFQIGTIDLPDAFPVTDEVTDLTCEEVIHRQVRWTPDASSWFDYTQDPPAINIVQRSKRAPISIAVKDTIQFEARPRYDLVIQEVLLTYKRVDVTNGVGYLNVVVDKAPVNATGRAFSSIVQTFNLEGAQVSYSLSTIVCEAIDADSSNQDVAVGWWSREYPPLADKSVANATIKEVARQTSLPRRLRSGNITAWMLARSKATAVRELITAKADWDIADDKDTILESRRDRPITAQVTATDLQSGEYISSFSATPGESVPVGLANYIWQATNPLHYDGTIVLSEDECSGAVSLANVVNVTGAQTEHQTMRAVVQSIAESIDDGQTTVTIGPPKHLGLDDIIEFLRSNRTRRRTTPASAMTDGQSFTVTPVDIGKETPRENSASDLGKVDKFTVGQYVVVDRADNPSNRAVKLREIKVCDDSSGTPKERKMLILASEIYD